MKKYIFPLIVLILISFGLLLFTRFTNFQGIKSVNINTIDNIDFTNSKNVLLDVRSETEFNEGHIPMAKNMNVMSPNFDALISGENKDRNYFIYCRSGSRSLKAYSIMQKLGFKNVTNLEGGILSYKGKIVK